MRPMTVNILLVEDNPGDALLISEMLKETAYASANFHTAPTLREAMRSPFAPGSVTMVLLDLNLPDSEGIATLHEVMVPYRESAIVVLTGMDDDRLALEALRHGAQNYLTKGRVGPEELERTLRYAVERHGFVVRLREADRELVVRERRFRSLVEHSAELILMLDPTGHVTYASPATHRLYGFTPFGMNAFKVLHPEDIAEAERKFAQALEHPEKPFPLLVRTTDREGRSISLEGTITNLLPFPGVEAVVLNLHDVTARVNALAEVETERNVKHALINSTTDMMWSVDNDLRVITANEAFIKAAREFAGHEIVPGQEAIPPVPMGHYDNALWAGHYERALAGESFTIEAHTPGPGSLWGEISYNPIREGDRTTGVACYCRDVTARKRAEKDVRRLNARLEERVRERTSDLLGANASLEAEVDKNRRLSDMLAVRNRDLMDSIGYARRIQEALFPDVPAIPFFRESACLALPRNVVSGDFLWHHDTATHMLLAVADCTGHGVPGALMSVLGNNLLDRAVADLRSMEPDRVLTEVDRALHGLFTKHGGDERMYDGMDVGLIAIDKTSLALRFAGALVRCNILRDGALHVLDCVRRPIGGHFPPGSKRFTAVGFQLMPGDRIVVHTDGYQSQFGGPRGRKLNGPALRTLLSECAGHPAAEAIRFLEDRFMQWKGSREQMDDVLVVALDV